MNDEQIMAIVADQRAEAEAEGNEHRLACIEMCVQQMRLARDRPDIWLLWADTGYGHWN